MKILKGGTAEIELASGKNRWKKFDIELDESDLQAIVVKNNIDYDKLTVGMKYSILVKQAEILVTVEFESEGQAGEKSSRDLIQEFALFLNSMPKVED